VPTDPPFDLDLSEVWAETTFAFTSRFPAVLPPPARCPSEDNEIDATESLESIFLRDDIDAE